MAKRKPPARRGSRPPLSQHFLRDDRVARRIVSYASISPGERVLEIGPGRGALTGHLLDTGAKVYAIEADRRMAEALLREMDRDNLQVIIADATRVRFPQVDKVVSNLPYHVTTPLVLKVLESPAKLAVLTVQKEYADRMAAGAGEDDYGRLSVAVACRAQAELMETLPPGAFDPPPKVRSAVVRLKLRPSFPFAVKDERFFFEVVRALFSQRRKKIGTVIRAAAAIDDVPHRDARPETLTPPQLGEVADAVYEALARRLGPEALRPATRPEHVDEDLHCASCSEWKSLL